MTDDTERKLQAPSAHIDALGDPDLNALQGYWSSLRRGSAVPSRADFDPAKFPRLLAHMVLFNVESAGRYTVRLVGDAVQSFVGRNTVGKSAGSFMSEHSAAIMTKILDAVVAERAPKFRAGKAQWSEEISQRAFEVCFLPWSSNGSDVNIIMAAVKFPS